jgi:hypothetical protein
VRTALLVLLLTLLAAGLHAAQAPLPAGWPAALQFGMADAPGGGARFAQTMPGGIRYTYFSGGANTGAGWSTWNSPSGQYATIYFQECIANGLMPGMVYYQLLQSTPHSGATEEAQDLSNFDNLATMQAWFADFTLLLQKAGAYPTQLMVVNVEPDFWGHVEQAASANGGVANVTGMVGSCGGAVASYADNAAGLAQAIIHLRDLYAPNVRIGFNASIWGTGWDLLTSTPTANDAKAAALGVQSAAFFTALGADLDVLFGETLDRDSGYAQVINGETNLWFQPADYRRLHEFFANLSQHYNRRIILWQTPLGNTLMQSCNNSWGHYQSNQAEWFLGGASATNLDDFADAGVIAILFGGGQSGDTGASDAEGDGVTNPGALPFNQYSSDANPNSIQAVLGSAGSAAVYSATANTLTTPNAADDDGGYLRWRLATYYQGGAITLGTGAGAASQLAFIVQPSTTIAGSPIAPALQVAIEDGTGTVVAASSGSVTLALGSGSGALAGTLTVAAVNGVATFSDLHIDTAGSGFTIIASAGALSPATSSSFSIATPGPPAITSFSPPAAGFGASVTVTGTNLVGVSSVSFNGAAAAITASLEPTQVTATVPAGASSGPISLIASGGSAISSTSFVVVPPPTISAVSPGSGGAGTTVTITGSNFATATAVSFNGTAATFAVNGAGTVITTTVPGGATDGPITVTTLGGAASSGSYTTGISPAGGSSSSKKCGSGLFSALPLLLLLAAVARRRP